MFILNKKTGTVQECHNNDAIKACRKDAENYAVSERCEDLVQKPAEEPKKEEVGNSSPDTTKADSGAAEGAQNGENGEGEGQQAAGEGQQAADEGKQVAGEGAGELDEAALQAMNVATLREMAKSKGIQGYGNMNKGTLVAMILNH